MNIRVNKTLFICNPHIIEFKVMDKPDGKKLALMIDDYVAKFYKDYREMEVDRDKIAFSIGLTEPTCDLTKGE